MLRFAMTLYVVLASAEVPHEVTPVHEVALIRQEEAQVVYLRRHFHHDGLAAMVVRHLRTAHTTKPALVRFRVVGAVHTREQHVLCILQLVLCVYNKV